MVMRSNGVDVLSWWFFSDGLGAGSKILNRRVRVQWRRQLRGLSFLVEWRNI